MSTGTCPVTAIFWPIGLSVTLTSSGFPLQAAVASTTAQAIEQAMMARNCDRNTKTRPSLSGCQPKRGPTQPQRRSAESHR
jgi:hypothetical protein